MTERDAVVAFLRREASARLSTSCAHPAMARSTSYICLNCISRAKARHFLALALQIERGEHLADATP